MEEYPRNCECGREGLANEYQYTQHLASKGHAEALAELESRPEPLDRDLEAIIALKDEDPGVIGKMLRYAFAARGWPNRKHPGTVSDFMKEHDLPRFDIARGRMNQSEADHYRSVKIKEYIRDNE